MGLLNPMNIAREDAGLQPESVGVNPIEGVIIVNHSCLLSSLIVRLRIRSFSE